MNPSKPGPPVLTPQEQLDIKAQDLEIQKNIERVVLAMWLLYAVVFSGDTVVQPPPPQPNPIPQASGESECEALSRNVSLDIAGQFATFAKGYQLDPRIVALSQGKLDCTPSDINRLTLNTFSYMSERHALSVFTLRALLKYEMSSAILSEAIERTGVIAIDGHFFGGYYQELSRLVDDAKDADVQAKLLLRWSVQSERNDDNSFIKKCESLVALGFELDRRVQKRYDQLTGSLKAKRGAKGLEKDYGLKLRHLEQAPQVSKVRLVVHPLYALGDKISKSNVVGVKSSLADMAPEQIRKMIDKIIEDEFLNGILQLGSRDTIFRKFGAASVLKAIELMKSIDQLQAIKDQGVNGDEIVVLMLPGSVPPANKKSDGVLELYDFYLVQNIVALLGAWGMNDEASPFFYVESKETNRGFFYPEDLELLREAEIVLSGGYVDQCLEHAFYDLEGRDLRIDETAVTSSDSSEYQSQLPDDIVENLMFLISDFSKDDPATVSDIRDLMEGEKMRRVLEKYIAHKMSYFDSVL